MFHSHIFVIKYCNDLVPNSVSTSITTLEIYKNLNVKHHNSLSHHSSFLHPPCRLDVALCSQPRPLYLHCLPVAYVYEGVKYEEGFIQNSRGMDLFVCSWLPSSTESKALIFICHPYALQCNIAMKDAGLRLAKAGFAVYGIDYEGHGNSSGLQGYISSFGGLVNDCFDHFASICEKEENKKKARILFGQLMGGVVAILLHLKNPNYWDGAVLLSPMCKLADNVKPHPILINVLKMLLLFIPTWRIVPVPDLVDVSYKLSEVREVVRSSPYFYKGRPRLQTSYQMLITVVDIEQRLQEISLPFLVLHGGQDKVTDPTVSKLLYEKALSKDKTIKVYPGMWHHLLFGELPENIETVLSDVVAWLDDRVAYISKK